jgi:hypothetical protein
MTTEARFPFHAPAIPVEPDKLVGRFPEPVKAWYYADRPDNELTRFEPDKVQWLDPATGLDCLIVRNPVGALCGYVGVTRQYREYGRKESYTDLSPINQLEVHGGVTFTDRCNEDAPEGTGVCHVPFPGRTDDIWWIGFDCAHSGDDMPWMAEVPGTNLRALLGGSYRDINYVKSEVTHLARQIKENNRA